MSDPEGSRPYIGALLLGYFEPDGRLAYAGRVGHGHEPEDVRDAAQAPPSAGGQKMPLATPPPRDNRFGRPLKLARVHWLRPELVAEITYLSWPDDGLLRHTVFVGLREDKPAREVRRETPRASRTLPTVPRCVKVGGVILGMSPPADDFASLEGCVHRNSPFFQWFFSRS